MKNLLGGMAAAIVLTGLIWTAPATAATPKAAGVHTVSAAATDISAQRYRRYRAYPRYRYRPYVAPYYYGGPAYYPYPYYRPYYRPGFFISTPFFGFGF
jgi:hypothetical protein